MKRIFLQVGPSIGKQSFGVGYVITQLSLALHRAGACVYIVTADNPRNGFEACEAAGFPREMLICEKSWGHPRFAYAPALGRKMRKIVECNRAVIQTHGLWTYTSWLAGAISRESKSPMVIMPHGELDSGALAFSPVKKNIANLLFARRNIGDCSCMWALTTHEQEAIRRYGYSGRLAVIPNGMSAASEVPQQAIAEFRQKHKIGNRRILLFLSRIARKKNLPLLIESFAVAVKTHPDWVLVIAGGDECNHLAEVTQMVRDFDICRAVRFIGPVFGRDKATAFASSSIFVLPSQSEGLPIVALEAMEYGKPLLITDAWDLPAPDSERFCWRLKPDPASFHTGLLKAMSAPEPLLAHMGRAGQVIVRKHFNWDSVAKQAIDLYASLDGQIA
jgi:glycosyltransferase involved in cell wall biosynthesis